jgi:hypothetical protein
MIDYQFNIYRISKEKAPQLSATAYELMRAGRGVYTGQQIGELLYKAKIEGVPFKELNKMYYQIPYQNIKAMLSGSFAPDAYAYFCYMVENEKEILDRMFK